MGVSMVPVRAWTLDQVCHILVMKIMARPGRRASCAFWSWRSWQESCYGSGGRVEVGASALQSFILCVV
eukprot:scaffold122746_cov20-Tisochrysis_lutea.AAC.1